MTQETVWWVQVVTQILGLCVFTVGMIVALVQFRLSRRQRILTAITEVLKEIADEQYGYHDDKLLRHWLCQRSKPLEQTEFAALPQPQRERIMDMALAHDRMCFFIHQGGWELRCIHDWQQHEIRRLWWALAPVITGMQVSQHGFCKMFEKYGSPK
jgi:hypothetical protein